MNRPCLCMHRNFYKLGVSSSSYDFLGHVGTRHLAPIDISPLGHRHLAPIDISPLGHLAPLDASPLPRHLAPQILDTSPQSIIIMIVSPYELRLTIGIVIIIIFPRPRNVSFREYYVFVINAAAAATWSAATQFRCQRQLDAACPL